MRLTLEVKTKAGYWTIIREHFNVARDEVSSVLAQFQMELDDPDTELRIWIEKR